MRIPFILVVVAALLAVLPVLGLRKEKEKETGRDLDATLQVHCGDTNPDKQLNVISPTLVAKKGDASAWVKVESAGCRNATELWIATSGNQPFRLAYRQRPQDPDLWGNGMKMVDWSPDGQLLLTEAWQWDTESSSAPVDKRILLFQAGGAEVSDIDLDAIWADQKDRDCQVQFQLLGFTADGWVALKAHISNSHEDGAASEKPCAEKSQVWAISPVKQNYRLLPDDFQAARNSVLTKTAKMPE